MKYALFVLGLLILPTLALAATTTGAGFVPLTNIPFIKEAGNSFSLDQFLNGLFRIAIGAAAALAVLQIMRAGIIYMGGDSVTEKKEAKNLIALAIGGLILVLSPVVVFSVINPDILSLKIANIEDLNVPLTGSSTPTVSAQICNGYTTKQWATVPTGQQCSNVLSPSAAWVTLSDNVCCAGTPTAGQVCCGYDKNYVAPAPQPGDAGTFTYKVYYKDEAYIENSQGQEELTACYAFKEEAKTSLSLCEAALAGAQSAAPSPGAATAKNCIASEASTPTPASTWSTLSALPRCPSQ